MNLRGLNELMKSPEKKNVLLEKGKVVEGRAKSMCPEEEEENKTMTESEILTLKKEAGARIGIPAELISGDTPEEISAYVNELEKFKGDNYKNMSTRDKFALWLNGYTPTENAVIQEAQPAYPKVPDGGEVNVIVARRDPRDAFKEWFADVSAFNPYKTYGNF